MRAPPFLGAGTVVIVLADDTAMLVTLKSSVTSILPDVIRYDMSLACVATPCASSTRKEFAAAITPALDMDGATINLHNRGGRDRRRRTIASRTRTKRSPS